MPVAGQAEETVPRRVMEFLEKAGQPLWYSDLMIKLPADQPSAVPLTPEERDAIAASKAAAARGEFATDEEVRAVWSKHGL